MSTPQIANNKATVRRLHELWNIRDVELISKTIDEAVHPDMLLHTPMGEATGPGALKQVMAIGHRVFPDLHVTVEDVIAEGDKVVARNTVTGTHQGQYLGLPPTGKRVAYSEIFIFRFSDGRVAEISGVVDVFSQMRQLGAIQVQGQMVERASHVPTS